MSTSVMLDALQAGKGNVIWPTLSVSANRGLRFSSRVMKTFYTFRLQITNSKLLRVGNTLVCHKQIDHFIKPPACQRISSTT